MNRLTNSIKLIPIGIIMIIAAVVLLFWNEGNNVANIKSTDEAKKIIVQINCNEINPANQGRLVGVNGTMNLGDQPATDTEHGVSEKTAKLTRVVEMYQWQEKKEENNKKVTYTYEKVWSQEIIDSSRTFHDSNHQNPSDFPFKSSVFCAPNVTLGKFRIPNEILTMLDTKTKMMQIPKSATIPSGYQISGDYITNAKDLISPNIGDVRTSYFYNNSSDVSIAAKQVNDTFSSYTTANGKTIEKIVDGIHTSGDVISIIEKDNQATKWILRLFGFILSVFGFSLLFGPLNALGANVPILGSLVGMATFLIGLISGTVISLITIAVAWIFFRPLIGILLLCAVAVLIFLLMRLKKQHKAKTVNI